MCCLFLSLITVNRRREFLDVQGKRGLSPDIVIEHSLEYLQNRHSGVVIQVEHFHI